MKITLFGIGTSKGCQKSWDWTLEYVRLSVSLEVFSNCPCHWLCLCRFVLLKFPLAMALLWGWSSIWVPLMSDDGGLKRVTVTCYLGRPCFWQPTEPFWQRAEYFAGIHPTERDHCSLSWKAIKHFKLNWNIWNWRYRSDMHWFVDPVHKFKIGQNLPKYYLKKTVNSSAAFGFLKNLCFFQTWYLELTAEVDYQQFFRKECEFLNIFTQWGKCPNFW